MPDEVGATITADSLLSTASRSSRCEENSRLFIDCSWQYNRDSYREIQKSKNDEGEGEDKDNDNRIDNDKGDSKNEKNKVTTKMAIRSFIRDNVS